MFKEKGTLKRPVVESKMNMIQLINIIIIELKENLFPILDKGTNFRFKVRLSIQKL